MLPIPFRFVKQVIAENLRCGFDSLGFAPVTTSVTKSIAVKCATAGSRRQQASGLCSPDAEGFISRFVSIRVDSWLTSCAGDRTRGNCALSAMLTVSQLSKCFAGRALFDDVLLQVNRGDRINFQS